MLLGDSSSGAEVSSFARFCFFSYSISGPNSGDAGAGLADPAAAVGLLAAWPRFVVWLSLSSSLLLLVAVVVVVELE